MTSTPPQCSKDGPLRRLRRHRNRPQGSDTPPLFARRRIVSSCTTLVLPSNYKRKGLGLFLEDGGRITPCNTHTSQPPESNVSSSPHDTSPRPGTSSLSHLACNPLLQALRCKEYKIDLSDWTWGTNCLNQYKPCVSLHHHPGLGTRNTNSLVG